MIRAYEVLVGVFSNIPENQRQFDYDSEKFFSFFAENKNNYKILRNIQFEKRIFTHSDELDEAFSNMIGSGSVTFMRGTLNPHYIKSACDIAYTDFVKPDLKSEEISEIEDLSHEFTKKFCIEQVLN